MFRTVTVDVVMGSNGFFELIVDDHTRTLCARTTGEHHDSRTGVRVSSLAAQRLAAEVLKPL